MEKRINIAELLKDYPMGMELDCTMFDDVTLLRVDNSEGSIYPITVLRGDGNSMILTKYGQCADTSSAKCVIFPKGKTTWEGFVPSCKFKDGDIVADKKGNIAIYKQIHKFFNEPHIDFYCGVINDCGFAHYNGLFVINNNEYQNWGKIKYIEFATEEEKQKLFNAIKNNGYRWNAETKTLEKLIIPRFKVGDTITNGKTSITIDYIDNEYYYEIGRSIANRLFIKNQDEWELVPNKFDPNTLKTFDQVLVRLTNNCVWMPKLFSHYATGPNVKYYPFVTIDNIGYPQCVPYNGNEHLSRTTNNCDKYYITWE